MDYTSTYEKLHAGLETVDEITDNECIAICQQNNWLKKGGYPFNDEPFLEYDSPYTFKKAQDLETLKLFFFHGNWSIRTGILYQDLLFVNQINDGDEWWTLKRNKAGKWIPFESISFEHIIKDNEFEGFMQNLIEATIKQCKNLTYKNAIPDRDLEQLWDTLTDIPIDPDTEQIDTDWHIFTKGTDRIDIWRWFDERHTKGVHWLLYERR